MEQVEMTFQEEENKYGNFVIAIAAVRYENSTITVTAPARSKAKARIFAYQKIADALREA